MEHFFLDSLTLIFFEMRNKFVIFASTPHRLHGKKIKAQILCCLKDISSQHMLSNKSNSNDKQSVNLKHVVTTGVHERV